MTTYYDMYYSKLKYSLSESAKAYYEDPLPSYDSVCCVRDAIQDACRRRYEVLARAVMEAKRGDWFKFVYGKKVNGIFSETKTEYYRVVVRGGRHKLKATNRKPGNRVFVRIFSLITSLEYREEE